MTKGKLIVIEGCDGSGKATQTALLYEKLKERYENTKKVSFPDYESPSSSLAKMYLKGDFGSHPEDVNPYAASTFYAADRFASFKMKWGKLYNNGDIIIADRYTTSNMVHQASKIKTLDEKDKFLDWLIELEYGIYSLPKPDLVFFLDMPPKVSEKLIKERANKFTGKSEKDIHENDEKYLEHSYNNALYISNKYNWTNIKCTDGNKVYTIEEINSKILEKVQDIL